MRKILLSLLLAGVAASPALADRPQRDRGDDSERDSSHEESRSDHSSSSSKKSESPSDKSESRQEARDARPERSQRSEHGGDLNRRIDVERPANVERHVDVQRPAEVREHVDVQRPAVVERRADTPRRDPERTGHVVRPSNVNERGRPTLGEHSDDGGGDSVTNWRQHERDNAGDRTIRSGELSRRTRVRPPADARPDRPAPLPETASRDSHRRHHHWRSDWRHDHRYDWHNHRRHHRSLFHLGFYYDPFGWSYHRYNVGWRLWPSYYSSDFWLNDPYQYRLPYAPWPYRWVRYYNDALLVDTYTGEVVDTIYGFFW